MRAAESTDRPPAHRRVVVAAPLERHVEEDLSRVPWVRTIARLALEPDQHPWKRGWRLRHRAQLVAVAAALLLLALLATSGCASAPLQSLSRATSAPRPAAGARCESVLVSQEIQVPLEGELADLRLTIRDLPQATGKLHVLVRQPRFASVLELDSEEKPAFDQVLQVASGRRELTVVLRRPRRAPSDWPRASCSVCRVDVELTGLFGARDGLDAFLGLALREAAEIEAAFSQQATGRSEHPGPALRELGAGLAAEGKRCGVPLQPAVMATESALAQLDTARASFYAGERPELPDATQVLHAWRAVDDALEGLPHARWPGLRRLHSAVSHLNLALQASALSGEDKELAALWIALALAPDDEALSRRSAALPRIRDLADAEARLAWVDPHPGTLLPLPGASQPATLRVTSFAAPPHGRRCIGTLGAAPVRDRAAEATAVAILLGADVQQRLRIPSAQEVPAARETLKRARSLLCEPLTADVDALFSGLEQRELGPVAEQLESIYAEADPRRQNDEVARAVSARADALLCRLFAPETIERRVTSVLGYQIFVEGGTHLLEFLPHPLMCEGRGISAREVRKRLREAYRAAIDRHAVADRLCPVRGGKCPEEVAASVRRLFALRSPELAAPAAADSRALDFPPPFGFSDAWVEKLDRCAKEACDALARLRSEAPPGQFEGSICPPRVEGKEDPQEITLDKPESPSSVTLSSCDAHAGVRLTLHRKPEAGTLVSIASSHAFRYGSENVTRQGRHPQLGRIYERVADLTDPSDVSRRSEGVFEVALTPTVENQVFYFFSLRRRDY
jgi:hypothetical protein